VLENHAYNLVSQLTEESRSLWRLKNVYSRDADCDTCHIYFQKAAQEKEDAVAELRRLVKTHLEQ